MAPGEARYKRNVIKVQNVTVCSKKFKNLQILQALPFSDLNSSKEKKKDLLAIATDILG